MKSWVLLWLAIGAVTCVKFPRYLPRRAVHVLFMHHEPLGNNTLNASDSTLYRRHSMRSFYQQFFNFLHDSLSFGDYDTIENYSVEDPWVHFIDKGNTSKLNATSAVANKTEAVRLHLNPTTVAPDASSHRQSGNDTSVSVKIENNSTDGNKTLHGMNENKTNTEGEHRIKRIRREFKISTRASDVEHEQSNATNATLTATNETIPLVNFSKETLDDDFTISVEKMIAFIDEQLENKTQAILKRIKRVGDLVNDVIAQDTTVAVHGTSVGNKTQKQSEEMNTKPNTTEPSIVPKSPTEAKATPTLAFNILTSKQSDVNSKVPPQKVELNPPSVQPTARNISDTSDPAIASKTDSTLDDNKSTSVVSNKIYNITETTSRLQDIFEVPDGMSEELSDFDIMGTSNDSNIETRNHYRKNMATSNEPTTDSDIELIEFEEKEQSSTVFSNAFRKMMEAHNPITVNSDIELLSADKEYIGKGDVMKALVIPVFLVVLMGSLLFAMHNMSRYFVQRTNTGRPVATIPERVDVFQMEMTSGTNPMEAGNTSASEKQEDSGNNSKQTPEP